MKKFFFLSVFAIFAGSLQAQVEQNVHREVVEARPVVIPVDLPEVSSEDNTIYIKVQEKAQYPGGNEGIKSFIENNLKYPAGVSVQGKVIVEFVIEKDGSVYNVKVARSIDPLLDAEAIRVISLMKGWIPAKNGSKVVRSKYRLPVDFKL